MSRECRKCNEIIPFQTKIDGKTKNLQNRKFCLKCSPFKKHNTSSYDPTARRRGKCYKDYCSDDKEKAKLNCYWRGLRIRDELYNKHGGKCIKCGYDKCQGALSFHHRDPSQKIFGLSLNMLWSKSKEDINKESEKCDLLCQNCHAEVEDAICRLRENHIVGRVNKYYGTNY